MNIDQIEWEMVDETEYKPIMELLMKFYVAGVNDSRIEDLVIIITELCDVLSDEIEKFSEIYGPINNYNIARMVLDIYFENYVSCDKLKEIDAITPIRQFLEISGENK